MNDAERFMRNHVDILLMGREIVGAECDLIDHSVRNSFKSGINNEAYIVCRFIVVCSFFFWINLEEHED